MTADAAVTEEAHAVEVAGGNAIVARARDHSWVAVLRDGEEITAERFDQVSLNLWIAEMLDAGRPPGPPACDYSRWGRWQSRYAEALPHLRLAAAAMSGEPEHPAAVLQVERLHAGFSPLRAGPAPAGPSPCRHRSRVRGRGSPRP